MTVTVNRGGREKKKEARAYIINNMQELYPNSNSLIHIDFDVDTKDTPKSNTLFDYPPSVNFSCR